MRGRLRLYIDLQRLVCILEGAAADAEKALEGLFD